MQLTELKIQNFRCYSAEASFPLNFKEGVNTIVGENSVGKSTILKAIEVIKGNYTINEEDKFNGNKNATVTIRLTVQLTDNELMKITADALNTDFESDEVGRLMNLFGNSVTVTTEILEQKKRQTFRFDRLRDQALPAEVARNWPYEQKAEQYFYGLFNSKMKIFSEVRKRPGGDNKKILESLDGSYVADVLSTLKNGNNLQRKKFEQIKEQFKEIFPKLDIEVMDGENGTPTVMVEKEPLENEVSIDRVGAGIGEMITLITHIIASEGLVFGLDMPELHLHPHAQRLLLKFLKNNSINNQFILITHSPNFIDNRKLSSIIVVRDNQGIASTTQLPEDYFSDEEKQRLDRNLDIFNRELFFSRSVLMVEGDTEIGALPVFAQELGVDFDAKGISLVKTGKHFGLMMKLCQKMGLPYIVLVDKDAIMNIERSIDSQGKRVKTSPLFFNLETAALLSYEDKEIISKFQQEILLEGNNETYPNRIFEDLQGIARKYKINVLNSDFEGIFNKPIYTNIVKEAHLLSASKVTTGRIIAEDIIELNLPIPSEIRTFINQAKKNLCELNK